MPKNIHTDWGDFELKADVDSVFRLDNSIDVILRRFSNEVWIASRKHTKEISEQTEDEHDWRPGAQKEQHRQQSDVAQDNVETHPEKQKADNLHGDLKWSRWVLKSKNFKLGIYPAFPNLPVVVKPEYEFRLMPGAQARFYTRIPMWIQLLDAGDKNLQITEIPSINLVRTWFGSFTNGEICYWFQTTARREVSDDIFRPNLCVCPIIIKNESDEELNIDKLCLRGERLSVFKGEKSLWSDQMTIEYKGGNNFSDLVVSGKPPTEAPGATLIGKPRNPMKKGFAERTFKIINELQAKIG